MPMVSFLRPSTRSIQIDFSSFRSHFVTTMPSDNLIDQAIYSGKLDKELRFTMAVDKDCFRAVIQTMLDAEIVSSEFNMILTNEDSRACLLDALCSICRGEWRNASIDLLAIERLEKP